MSAESNSSTLLKTTKVGRPFVKDTLDLFATLIVSLRLGPHKQFFRTYLNSFSTDEAITNLSKLKFSQSNRHPDPTDPSRVLTTTTITTFSMSPEMAMTMSQNFMDARLITNSTDYTSTMFRERGVYTLSPKGLHVLERFISKNGIQVRDDIQAVFSTQPVCEKVLHVERRMEDDEIIVSQSVVTTLFRRFVGRAPNYFNSKTVQTDRYTFHEAYAKGIPLNDITIPSSSSSGPAENHKHCFSAPSALEWLCSFVALAGKDEAAEIAAHFVRFGFLVLVCDKQKDAEHITYTVRGPVQEGTSTVSRQGEFRCSSKAIYKITSEGMRIADWTRSAPSSSPSSTSLPSSVETGEGKKHPKESNVTYLRHIFKTPQLRSAFSSFLRNNYCEENLLFYLDVQDLRKKFFVSSSAVAASSSSSLNSGGGGTTPTARKDAENHHTTLLNTALGIYDMYFATRAPRELNLDSASRTLLAKHRESAPTSTPSSGGGATTKGRVWNSSELQRMIALYEDISGGIFRLMATDSVPKFIQTPEFAGLRWLLDEDEIGEESEGAGAGGVMGGNSGNGRGDVGVDEGVFSPALLQVQGQPKPTQTPSGKEARGGVYATVSQIAKEFSASRLSSSSSSS